MYQKLCVYDVCTFKCVCTLEGICEYWHVATCVYYFRQQFQQKNKMTIFRSLALPIIVVLIRTLVETDVTSAQQAQTNNASHLLHDQITNLLKGNPTPQQVRCVVCAGLADDVAQCRDVRDVG